MPPYPTRPVFIPDKSVGEQLMEIIYEFEWIRNETPMSSISSLITACFFYLMVIGVMWYWRRDQKALSLRFFMGLHNLFLVIISAIMWLGTMYAVVEQLQHGVGLWDMFCDPNRTFAKGPLYFWSYCFYLSKYYEFMDTLFIVLKKKPLTFLHLYHHLMIVCLTWVGMDTMTTNQWMGLLFNTFVHVVMYYYYFMANLGMPPKWKRWLTTMQMVQFWCISGLLFVWLFLHRRNAPQGCSGELWSWGACLFGQVSLYLLFSNFYQNTYQKKDKEQ